MCYIIIKLTTIKRFQCSAHFIMERGLKRWVQSFAKLATQQLIILKMKK
jgi:hypothetical protein